LSYTPSTEACMRLCTIGLTVLGLLLTSCGDSRLHPPPGILTCNGAQVNVLTDSQHCGSCTATCGGATPLCSSGRCVAACPLGQTMCGSSCVDRQTDAQHCGDCGNACGSGQSCVGADCVAGVCPPNTMACGTGCVDRQGDPNNCGGCGVQ